MSEYQIILPTAITVAYLFGSISSAIIVCKLMGLPDPRTAGSKNPGATNVLRLGGKKAALITLLGDALKGLLPILIAKFFGFDAMGLALVMLAAFLGHLFPIFFGFTGGKGVATFIGCLLALSWPIGLSWLGAWLITAGLFRYSSLASLTATLLSPLFAWYFTHQNVYVLIMSLMAIILIYRHRENISKLWHGRESKIGQRSN